MGGVPGPIAVGPAGIWVADGEHRLLYEFDLAGLHHLRTIALPQPAYALASGPGSVWVGNGFDGTVTRVKAGGFVSPPMRVEPHSTGRLALAYGDGAFWVGSQDGVVTRADPRDGRALGALRRYPTGLRPAGALVAQPPLPPPSPLPRR